jgi:4-hydroxy-tetrahydrodipicolinate synthase
VSSNLDPKWRGYLAAIVTPFNQDGSIDAAAFRENIRNLLADRVHGIVVSGTTGEYWALADDERKQLFEMAAEEASGQITVIGGTTASRAERVIDMSSHAAAVGLDGVMIAPPPGCRPNARELEHFFETIDRGVDIDVMLYNSPETYGADITPTLVSKLADLDHIAAIKESCASIYQQNETLRLAGDRIAVLGGWPGLRGLQSWAMGCVGAVGSIEAQVLGSLAREMWDCAEAGEMDRAREIQTNFIQLHHTVTASAGTAPAQLKQAMNLISRPGGYPRLPILPLSAEETERVSSALVDLGLEITGKELA